MLGLTVVSAHLKRDTEFFGTMDPICEMRLGS